MQIIKKHKSIFAILGVLFLLVFSLLVSVFIASVAATTSVSVENNGSRLIAKSDGTPSVYQWQIAYSVDGTYSPIEDAAQNYYDITANDEGKYIKAVIDGVETEPVGPIGKVVVFDLSKGKIIFNTTYSGKDSAGNDLMGDHEATNIYVIRQSNNATFTTNNVWFSGNHTNTSFDVTLDGVNMGRASYPTNYLPNTSTTGGYADGTIDIQPSGYAGQKNVVLRLKGENIVRAIHYYTNNYPKSSLKITDINGDKSTYGGSLYVPVKVDADKIDEFVNSNVSYNHWNSAIGGDDSISNVSNFEIAGGKLQVLTTYADNCTAIGAGGNGSCTMTISGGEIVAHCNGTGTAIGGGIGWFSQGGTSNITISGGKVYAKNHGEIYVNGDTITTKDKPYDKVVGGVAIGSGSSFNEAGSEGKVTITGGTVEAYGTFGNGIGGGNSSKKIGGKATIFISGGTVTATSIGGGNSKSGTGGTADVKISGTADVTLLNGIGGGDSLSGDGGEATITVNGGTMSAKGSIGGGAGGDTGNGGKAVVTVNGGNLTAASIGGGLGSIGGNGGAAEIYVNEGNGVIRTGTIGGGDTLNTIDGRIGYAKAVIKGGDISGQFLMAAGGTEACTFVMTGGTLHGVDTADSSVFAYAKKDGAAVYMDDPNGVVDISGGAIRDCSAKNGGAIYMSAGTCSISGKASVENCSSSENGGAIYLGGGTVTVNGGTIKNNSSKLNGGAVYLGGGTMTVFAGEILGNTAQDCGGAAYIDGGNVNVVGGIVINNTADNNGGGIAVNDGNYYMVGGNVDGNKAVSGSGGGIYVSANASDVEVGIYSGSVSSNTSGSNGGALAVVGRQDGTKKINVQIGVQKRHFDEDGNVICDHDQPDISSNSVTACPQLSGNHASESGGGVFVTGNKNTELNIYCLSEDQAKQNSAGADEGQSNFMKVEGGKVTITTSDQANMNKDDLNSQNAYYGNTQIKSTIYVTGGNMELWGEMTNPSISDVITVDITKDGDDFNDYRLNTSEKKYYKLKYFENFKDPVTGIITGQYKEYEIEENEIVTISANIYSHPGYTIKGWNTSNYWDDPVDQYYPIDLDLTEPSTPRPPESDKTLGWYKISSRYLFNGNPIGDLEIYAIWEANGYTVVYDPNANSYTGKMENDAFFYNQETKLKKNAYKRSGHDFVGWCMDKQPTDSSVVYEDEATISDGLTDEKGAVVTLYAQWKECDHSEPAHTYTYSVVDNGKTLRRDCSCGNYSQEARLSAENAVYDKTSHPASVEYTSDSWTPDLSYEALDGDALVNGCPYYAGRYKASITENGVTASVTYFVEKADQPAPPKPEYATSLQTNSSILSIKPVAPSPYFTSDKDGYDSEIEYKLVYYVNGEKQTMSVVTEQKPDTLIDGEYAVQFEVNVILTNYYVYANYTEGANYKASKEASADSIYFFAGHNVEILVNNPEGLLKEITMANGSEDNIQNGALLSLELIDGYYFPQGYDQQIDVELTRLGEGLPIYPISFTTQEPCSKYLIENIQDNSRIVITLPDVNLNPSLESYITEGQVFKNIEGDFAKISRDSAYTVKFNINHYFGTELETPALSFDSELAVGTTIIMQDQKGGGYYWALIDKAGITELKLTDFVRMGDKNKTPFVLTDSEMQLQFVVDFSHTTSAMSGDAVKITLTVAAKSASKARTATAYEIAYLKHVDQFTLRAENNGVITFLRDTSEGVASKWEYRESALVLIPNTTLPADAHLQLVCADATEIIYANCDGNFVYSMPKETEGTIAVSLISSLLIESETIYSFDVKWIVAKSQVEQSCMNAQNVASARFTISYQKQSTVSLKITGDKKLYSVGETVNANVSWADLTQSHSLEVVLMVKTGDGEYSSTGVTKEIFFEKDADTETIEISLAGNSAGSYRLQVTAELGLIATAEAEYYFIIE